VLRGYIADFQSATGIPVVVEVFAADEIVPRIRDKDGSIGTPDLFMGSHRWIAQLQAEGLVAEVKLPYPGQYFPLALDAFTVNGTLYGLPYAIESPALYRNTDLVPEALRTPLCHRVPRPLPQHRSRTRGTGRFRGAGCLMRDAGGGEPLPRHPGR
jgi:maltose-binding protein MalE